MRPSTPSPMASSPLYTAELSPPAKSSTPAAPGSSSSAINSSPAASKSPTSRDSWGRSTSPLDSNLTWDMWPTLSPSVWARESSHNSSDGWALEKLRCLPARKETRRFTSPSSSSPPIVPYPQPNPYSSGLATSSPPQGTSSTPWPKPCTSSTTG